MLAQGEDIVPIPGTTSAASYLEENAAAAEVELTEPTSSPAIDAAAPQGAAAGLRYPEAMMKMVGL